MPSTFAWLDTNERDRRRALDVIDLFSLRDTRDQLGLAGIRDAWSDRLAPGTSTIQTRARYFFFVPWIYLELERRKTAPDKVERRSRMRELDLIEAIRATDPEAVPIGARAGKSLKRLPSDIYWGGLGTLRIRLFEGARARYHRTFGDTERHGEHEVGAEDAPSRGNWNPHLPKPPEGFPKEASLQLTEPEAEFLRDQILQHASGSLIAFLVGLEQHWDDVEYSWDHPAIQSAPGPLRVDVEHARRFSLAMHGAGILYNLMLAERLPSDELIDKYRDGMGAWSESISVEASEFRAWDRTAYWSITYDLNPRIPIPSRRFADDWIDRMVAESEPRKLADDTNVRKRIEQRELVLKRNRARLRHREHLERWSGSSGAGAIDYRWPITQRIVRDIHEGLGTG